MAEGQQDEVLRHRASPFSKKITMNPFGIKTKEEELKNLRPKNLRTNILSPRRTWTLGVNEDNRFKNKVTMDPFGRRPKGVINTDVSVRINAKLNMDNPFNLLEPGTLSA